MLVVDRIKPVKLVKSVTGTANQGVHDSDVVNRPRIRLTPPTPPAPQGLDFSGDRMLYAGRDMSEVVRDMARDNPQALAALASELEDFKKRRLQRRNQSVAKNPRLASREDEELSRAFAACDAHIEQVGRHIQRRFSQTRDGFAVEFDEDGQLIMNGMNIHALIERCRSDATEKSRLFLKGIRARLGHMLANKSGTPVYEKLRGVVEELSREIDALVG